MFARGWAYLYTAPPPVPKNPAAKPCVSITSKLIQTKGLQVLYFGHLRKTGGRGELPAGTRCYGKSGTGGMFSSNLTSRSNARKLSVCPGLPRAVHGAFERGE